MEYIVDFFATNYIFVIIILVIVIMSLIGYYAEKTNFGEIKYSERNNKNKNEDLKDEVSVIDEPIEQIGIEKDPVIDQVENNTSGDVLQINEISNDESLEIESEDLEVAFEKAFQEQISLADSEYLDEDIDNMTVEPLFSSTDNVSTVIDSNIKLPEIKKIDLSEEIIWDTK